MQNKNEINITGAFTCEFTFIEMHQIIEISIIFSKLQHVAPN